MLVPKRTNCGTGQRITSTGTSSGTGCPYSKIHLVPSFYLANPASRYIYIYLGLGSYRLTIKERNGGVGIRGKNRVVDESTSCVANMNCEGFYDGETELL